MQFRKKPIVIEAVQWTGENVEEATAFLGRDFHGFSSDRHIGVDSREGLVMGPPGYWLMRGVQGEHYLCAPDIFAATYEPE